MFKGYKIPTYALLGILYFCSGSLRAKEIDSACSRAELIQFESLFPESSYKNVLRLCISVWHNVRAAQAPMKEEALKTFNLSTIADLVIIHNRMDEMLLNKNSCSPDDLEYLVAILCVMHGEYIAKQSEKFSEEVVCGTVLFDLLKKKLEGILLAI